MSLLKESLATGNVGEEMHAFISQLYPICRSITGDGLRQTLRLIKQHIPLTVHEVPSGTPIFDWTVPKEWNIRDAYIKNANGERVVDFNQSNLHVVGYSAPVQARLSWEALKQHLFTLPDQPDLIPYRTSYYKETWGFCLSHKQFLSLGEGEYEVCIDSSLTDGSLSYGEYFIRGQRDDEVLLSCHACHPSLCNDNLSGVALVTWLAKYLASVPLSYSYRFLFIPVTIGSIAWLSRNEDRLSQIKHGLVAASVGDAGKCTYKKTRRGNAEVDQAVLHVLKQSGHDYEVREFIPYGYDERQYCSPAFDLPVGSLTRTPNGRYPEYHTSADNLDFVRSPYLADSFLKYLSIIEVFEHNAKYRNTNPKCEPQLGRRGLYQAMGGRKDAGRREMALLWVLNLSDGRHSLLEIAERADMPFDLIHEVAQQLLEHHLLERLTD
jgi:aminopeptidase-like protein